VSFGGIALTDVFTAAREAVSRFLRPTPCETSAYLAARFGRPMALKLEGAQPTRSFKVRGALAKLSALQAAGAREGVVAASAGNHGLGVAWAARRLGLSADVFVPEGASPAKCRPMVREGARLHPVPGDFLAAVAAARAYAEAHGLPFVHAFDDEHVVAGQATVAWELDRELPDLRQVLVPVGGGGLLAGVATVLRRRRGRSVRIVGVEPAGAASLTAALAAGRPVRLPSLATAADGLAVAEVAPSTLAVAESLVDDVVTVPEAAIEDAMRTFLDAERLLVEPSAAVGLAALVVHPRLCRPHSALVVTGANVSPAVLRRVLEPDAPHRDLSL
jgi:threonine dehydratase